MSQIKKMTRMMRRIGTFRIRLMNIIMCVVLWQLEPLLAMELDRPAAPKVLRNLERSEWEESAWMLKGIDPAA
jgi:uncharacterized secreted protein with C-terminal beta-propeller domain